MTEVQVPSFDYAAFYYPQLIQALLMYKRSNVPELTDESDHEPLMHALKSFACIGHLNNVLLDLIANESTLPTAKLPETIRNMLRLIGYELSAATPSATELLCKLNAPLTATTEVVPVRAQFSIRRSQGDVPVIYFECLDGVTCPKTTEFGAVYSVTEAGALADHTSAANTGSNWTPWAATAAAGCKIYFGHANALWDKIYLEIGTASEITDGVWEFYDGNAEDTNPDSVTDLGAGSLQFDLTNLLGESNRAGALVRVTVLSTGDYEEVESTWNGSTNIVTTGLISQSTPSTDAEDYVVGVEWQEMLAVADGTGNFSQNGEITFTLPKDGTRDWNKTTINSFEGYFIRYRVVAVSGTGAPTNGVCDMDRDGTLQYVMAPVTQGRSVVGEVFGSSSGDQSQSFETVNRYFIWGSETVYVNSVEWTRVDNFLSSTSQDNHYVVLLGTDDKASIVFGNGTNGKVPPVGQANLVVDYRHNAEENGNVGANTIVIDKTGLRYISSVTNPSQAVGWAAAESSSEESLERAKIAGPASLRTISVALGPDELEDVVEAYTDSNGSRLFARSVAVEEGFGPKTLEVVVVPRGGGVATQAQLDELETYLNGDKDADPPIAKKVVANHRAVATNYSPRVVNVTATVEAPSSVTAAQVVTVLTTLLQPEAVKDDGVTYEWSFGGKVPKERIVHEIFSTSNKIRNVSTTMTDVQLGSRELPTVGTLTINIVDSI